MEGASELFDRHVNPDLLIRRLNLTTNHVVSETSVAAKDNAPQQLDLFTDYEALEKQRQVEQAKLDKERRMQEAQLKIKERFGKNAILRGLNFEEGATAKESNEQIGGHKAPWIISRISSICHTPSQSIIRGCLCGTVQPSLHPLPH